MVEPRELEDDIVACVDGEWRRTKSPILLSALGARLSEGSKSYVRENNITLKRFISERLGDRIRFLRMPRHGGGVVPLRETADLTDDQLESEFERRAPVRTSTVPRYKSRVWHAFGTQILQDRRRFISILASGVVQVSDAPSGEAASGGHEIMPSDIVTPEVERFALIRHEAIRNWASQNGVEFSSLLMPETPEDRMATATSYPRTDWATAHHDVGDLSAALDVLTPDELARILIPADLVVAALGRLRRR